MTMKGDLLSADLSNVFQMLAMNRKRGVLHIHNRENILEKRALVLDGDRVALFEVPQPGDLSGLLVDSGILSYDQWRSAREQAAQFGVRPTDFLRKKGELDDEQINGAIQRLHEELILEIFLWKNVGFQLEEDVYLEEEPGRVYFTLDLMVMEAARRQDEWLRVIDLIGGGRDIWAKTAFASNIHQVRTAADAAEEDALTDADAIVLDHLDGVRATPQVMADTGLPRYHVDLALYKLSERGMAAKMKLADLMDVGDQLVDAERVEDAIRVFKCAVRFDRRSITIHKRLASCYLKVGQVAKSAAHYKFCAIILLENELHREALTIYQYVVRILPTDFKALERALDILVELDEAHTEDDRRTIETGVRLATFYMDVKLFERAEVVLDKLLAILPEDVGLVFSKARCFAKTGRISEAVETYMKLAGRLYDLKDYDGAINAYKTVISFDTSSRPICQNKIAEICEILDRQQRRKMVGVSAVVFTATLILAVAGVIYYDQRADAAFDELASREFSETENGWSDHAAAFDALAKKFPLTQASRSARGEAEALRGRIRAHRTTMLKEAQRLEAQRASTLEEAVNAWSEADRLYAARELRAALENFELTLQKAHEANHEEWAKNRRLSPTIASLRELLAKEDERLTTLDRLIREGEYPQAFEMARQLLGKPDTQSLRADDIKVLSAEALRRIRVPVRVRVAPPGAELVAASGAMQRGSFSALLTHDEPDLELTITAEGYREKVVRLDWRQPRYETLVILEPRAERRLELGDRIVRAGVVNGLPTFVCSNGDVRLLAGGLSSAPRRVPVNGFSSLAGVPWFGERLVVYGTVDGTIRAIDVGARRVAWSRQLTSRSLDHIAVGHGRIAVAWAKTEGGRITILQLDTGRIIAEHEIPWVVESLAFAADGNLCAVDGDGGAWWIGGEPKRIGEGLRSKLARLHGAPHALADDGRLLRIEQGRLTDVTRIPRVSGELHGLDGLLFTIREDGFGVLYRGRGAPDLLRSFQDVALGDDVELFRIGQHIGVRDAGGGVVRLDPGTGGIHSRFAGPTPRSKTSIVAWRDHLLVTHGDRDGIVEVFPAAP